MRKEIECVHPTTIDQVLQRYLERVCDRPDSLGVYSFGIDGQRVYIYTDKYGNLVVEFGHLHYGTISLGSLHTLELLETRLYRAGLLSRSNAVVVKAKMFKG